ncbi:gamma-glutamyltransferase [Mycobacterium sp. smrl_JER01]|uniref:gamma-glutamyltransferase n=1 Tax=Mycobacterium sp. smrl_JER01 TaxID=3402633 RepID=UPI003AD09E61
MPVDALARRAVAVGAAGAVATGSRTAAAIGAQALLEGGNAFDAAVAAALAETVALPSKCGLAGDVVALFARPDTAEPQSLIAVGGAAAGLHDTAVARRWDVPATGPLSVGIPGAPAGYARLAALGTMPLPRLAAPAMELARRGIWWSPMNVLLERESRALLHTYQPQGCVYSPAGAPHPEGALVTLPGLEDVVQEFSIRGAALFTGPVGEALVDTVSRHGGVITAQELAAVEITEEPAHRVHTAAGTVWATNAPTFGTTLSRLIAGRHPRDVTPADVQQALRRGVTAEQSACAAAEGTSTVAAADASGNAVVIVHSLSFPQYGSGLVVPGYDLVLSNRAGRGFVFAADHPNAPVPGRRPPTTLHAWGLRRDGGWLLGATPGGNQQVPWNVQVLAGLLAGTESAPTAMGQAMCEPRWELGDDGSLRREGHEIDDLAARSAHTLAHAASGWCAAAADPRWDGAAVAV